MAIMKSSLRKWRRSPEKPLTEGESMSEMPVKKKRAVKKKAANKAGTTGIIKTIDANVEDVTRKKKRGPSDEELKKASDDLFSLKPGIRDRQKELAKTDIRHFAGELHHLRLNM